MLSDQYVAAFVDAEGHLGIRIKKGRRHPDVVLEVTNTHLQTLELIQEAMGVGRIKKREKLNVAGRKPQWRWTVIRKHDLVAVLVRLLPHLVQKAERALLALETLGRVPQGGGPNRLKTICKRGHLLAGANLLLERGGKKRVCRECRRRWVRESQRKRRRREKPIEGQLALPGVHKGG